MLKKLLQILLRYPKRGKMESLSSENLQLAEKVLSLRRDQNRSDVEIRGELGLSEPRHGKIMKYLFTSGRFTKKENTAISAYNAMMKDVYTLERIYAARTVHRCSIDAVCDGLGISYPTYQKKAMYLINHGLMTRAENDEINAENRAMENMDILQQVYTAKVLERMTNKDASKTLGIAGATYDRAVKELIRWQFVSREELDAINRESLDSRYDRMKKKHGDDGAAEIYRKGWRKGYGKNAAANAVKGGNATKKKAPYVMANLVNGDRYGQRRGLWRFRKAWFDSRGESRLAALLFYLGKLDEPVERKNVQVPMPVNTKMRLDILLDIGGKPVDLEWHPIPRERHLRIHDEASYYKDRKQKLGENGFTGDLVVISKWIDVFPRLKELGLVDNFEQYHKALIQADRAIGERKSKWGREKVGPPVQQEEEVPF